MNERTNNTQGFVSTRLFLDKSCKVNILLNCIHSSFCESIHELRQKNVKISTQNVNIISK